MNTLTPEEQAIARQINSAELAGHTNYARALFDTHFGKRHLTNDRPMREYRQRDEVAAVAEDERPMPSGFAGQLWKTFAPK